MAWSGSEDSGKSTIMKQMKIHQDGFSREELMAYRMSIYQPVQCKT